MVSGVCGRNQVRSTKTVWLASSQAWWWDAIVWGCKSAAGTEELQLIEVTMNANVLWHTEAENDSPQNSALLNKLRLKVLDCPTMSTILNPIEHLWGILKWEVEEHKVSNIYQLHDVIMEEWKRTPV